jgi:quercetin dioxygenase-like cupin family protein
MARTPIARDEMLKRVARFSDLTSTDPQSFGSERIPHGLSSYSVIGRGVANDPALQPPIAEAHGFNTVVVKAAPGTGVPLHAHATVEVFIPLNSQWVFYWGDSEDEQLTLAPWDTISFPAGLMHGFRNVGPEEGSLYMILGGTDAGRVAYEKRPA